MFTEYISQIINFNTVPSHKYENCQTREQYNNEWKENNKNTILDVKESFIIDASFLLNNSENELFSGDNIIGIYSKDGETNCCLYTWKENNPKEIVAYSLLHKFQVIETIDDLEIIQRSNELGNKKLLLTI